MLQGLGTIVLRQVNTAQKDVRSGVLGVPLQDAFDTHRRCAGVTLQEKDLGMAELGLGMLRLNGQNPAKDLPGLFQMKFIQTGMTIEQQQGRVVRRMLQGFAKGLKS